MTRLLIAWALLCVGAVIGYFTCGLMTASALAELRAQIEQAQTRLREMTRDQ